MISQGEITVPKKFQAISMCIMASSIYFNVLLHYSFPHQNTGIYLTFRKKLLFLHYKIKVTTNKTTFKSRVEYIGGNRPACSVMAISQFVVFLSFKNNCFFSAEVTSKRLMKRVKCPEILHLWTLANSR